MSRSTLSKPCKGSAVAAYRWHSRFCLLLAPSRRRSAIARSAQRDQLRQTRFVQVQPSTIHQHWNCHERPSHKCAILSANRSRCLWPDRLRGIRSRVFRKQMKWRHTLRHHRAAAATVMIRHRQNRPEARRRFLPVNVPMGTSENRLLQEEADYVPQGRTVPIFLVARQAAACHSSCLAIRAGWSQMQSRSRSLNRMSPQR